MSEQKAHLANRNRGNATVETILIAMVMVPVLSGVPLLGKLSDMGNATAQSSRYLAWEHTISGRDGKSEEDLRNEVRNRFFSKPDLLIQTHPAELNNEQNTNPMWTGFGTNDEGDQNLLISHESGMQVRTENENPGGVAGAMSQGIVTIGQTMARFTGGEWELEEDGLITATVVIDAATNPFMTSSADCAGQESETAAACITRSNTILVDGWEVGDADHAERRTQSLVPAAGLQEVGSAAVEVVGMVPFFADLGRLETDENGGFGFVNSEVVPMDRYAEE
jgi:Flp pilus assembly protein TadG